MKLLAQLSVVCLLASAQAQTLVQFSPSAGYNHALHPVAAGFAYAFHAPVHTSSAKSLVQPAPSNTVHVTKSLKVVPVLHSAVPAKKTVTKKAVVPKKALPSVLKTQYHSQDELGQYAYGYVHNDASHHEERTLNGGVTGRYSYYDQFGNKQSANYVADKNGYRVEATNLNQQGPLPVAQTPEVLAATQAHLLAVQNAKARSIFGHNTFQGVGDTPEVAAAKAAHLKAYNEIVQRHSGRWKRSAHRPFAYGYQHHAASYVHPHVPVGPTPAVQQATYEHLKAKQAAHKYGGAVHVGIPDTPAVAAAKNAHLYAKKKIALQHARRWRRSAHSPDAYHQRSNPFTKASYINPHVPVSPTPEVQRATYEHLKAKEASFKYGGAVHVGIPDTPEVAAAKHAHSHTYKKIAYDHAKRWKRSTWGPYSAGVSAYGHDNGQYKNDGREHQFDDGSYRPDQHYGAGSSYTPAQQYSSGHHVAVSGPGFVNAYQKPVAPYEPVIPGVPTAAVQAATQDHLQAKHETYVYGSHAHRGVQDTPEVAAAKLAHAQTFQHIANKHAKRWKRSTWNNQGSVAYGQDDGLYRDDHREHQFDDGSYRADQHYGPGDDGSYKPAHHYGASNQDQATAYKAPHATHHQAPAGHQYQPLQPVAPYVPRVPGIPTAAVQAATQAHLQAVHQTHVYGGHAHQGVQDTPTVAAAKEAHHQAFHHIAKEHAKRWRRSIPHSVSYNFLHPNVLTPHSVFVKKTAPVEPRIVKQYHAQDEYGLYEYGHSGGPSEKHEEKGADGVTRGHYSYLDPYGQVQSVHYEADGITGFKIISATNLP